VPTAQLLAVTLHMYDDVTLDVRPEPRPGARPHGKKSAIVRGKAKDEMEFLPKKAEKAFVDPGKKGHNVNIFVMFISFLFSSFCLYYMFL